MKNELQPLLDSIKRVVYPLRLLTDIEDLKIRGVPVETEYFLTPSANALELTDKLVSGSVRQWFRSLYAVLKLHDAAEYGPLLPVKTVMLLGTTVVVGLGVGYGLKRGFLRELLPSVDGLEDYFSNMLEPLRFFYATQGSRLGDRERKQVEDLMYVDMELQLARGRSERDGRRK